jgi:DNA-binding transcriptional LysR family regulator
MNWDDFKLALAIARTGSLNQAAQLLDVNQSTVSRRLTALEATIEARLFRRSPQGLVPTEAGSVFIARAAEMEARTEALVEALRQTDNRPAGVIRLLGAPWVIQQMIRSGLDEFLSANPDVELRTVSGRPESSLWRSEPGIGLWFETQPVDGAVAIPLGEVAYAFYRAVDADPTDWVAFYDENHPNRHAGLPVVLQADATARIRLTAVDAAMLCEAIAAGMGRGLLPLCLGEADPRVVRLTPATPPDLVRMLHFHAHPDSLGSPRVEALLAWIRANFATMFGGERRTVAR